MPDATEEKTYSKIRNRRVHMANERTFLAWIRTSVGIMAFGFVVEKFALFLKQVSYFLGRETPLPSGGYSSFFGIFLVMLGTLIGLLSFVRYKTVEKQIDEDSYRPSKILDIMLTLSVLAIGIFLMIYLIHSI